MENHIAGTNGPFRSIGRRLSLSITIACVASACLIGLFGYGLHRHQVIKAAGDTALGIAKALSASIDGDEYTLTMDREEKDHFWDRVRNVLGKAHLDTEAAFVYAVSPGESDHYKYFATGANDISIGFIRHKELFAREVDKTLTEGAYTRSWVYDGEEDAFGAHTSLVSGFAPIRNSMGTVVGAVGVDIGMDEELAEARLFLYKMLGLLALLTAGLTAFLLWETRRSIMHPLEAITVASGKLANGETRLPELPADRNDEIGLLARHFNQVARSVNSLAVGFIGSDSRYGSGDYSSNIRTAHLRDSQVPTAGLAGKYLATAQGINTVLTILDTLDCMVYVVDPETKRIIFYSRKFGEHYGIDPEQVWNKPCWEVIGCDKRCPTCSMEKLSLANASFPTFDYEMLEPKTQTWLSVKSRLIHWFDGRVVYLAEDRDISEQKRWQAKQAAHEQALRESTRMAEEANQMKTAFLANMSHEIRTPLNGVIGFAELAMEEPGTPTRTREFLQKISDSGEGLLQLINDILDVSKIETGKIELEAIPFTIHDVFMLCETICQPKALEKGNDLLFYEEPLAGRQLVGDPTKLRQVLLNLISNSLKFTSKGVIKVKCLVEEMRDNEVTLLFEVQDNGIGMTPDQLANVFKPFAQADGSITRKYGGTGLGLSISHNLVKMMGGDISVRSEPGRGSAFTFTVPVKIINEAADASRKAETTAIRTRPYFKGTALVCEDNRINQEVISEHLRRIGLEPIIADNGQAGLDIIRRRREAGEEPFSVIFMDIHMPIMDGLEATRYLRQMNVHVPIIALTANVMTTERERYLREGMADCIGKPFTSKKLWRSLMRFLEPIRLEGEVVDLSDQTTDMLREAIVNSTVGLAHAANNPDLYERQLRNFVEEQKDFIARLDTELETGNRKKAHRLAHTLKGVSALIGAEPLSRACQKLEEALAGDEMPKPERLAPLRTDVESRLEAVLGHFSSLGEDSTPGAGSQEEDDDQPHGDARQAKQVLTEILPLLRSSDAGSLEYLDRLRSIRSLLGKDGTRFIRNVKNYDFEAAAEIGGKILSDLINPEEPR